MSVKDSDLRQDLLGTIADEWAKIDPQGCFDWNMSLESSRDKNATLAVTMASIVNSGQVELAAKLISKIPKGELKDTAIIYSFYQISKEDVSLALNMISEISDGGTLKFSAERLALMSNKESRLHEAQEILNDLPPGTFRDYFGLGCVSNLADKDPTVALDWIGSNQDNVLSNNALLLVARKYGEIDPLTGIKMADRIKELGLREKYKKEIAMSWSEENPEAAGSWLLQKLLSEDKILYKEFHSRPTGRHNLERKSGLVLS